jgi:acetyl-CoA/propionyl-CoA carboxylase biotin carboxyl carrier protein
VEARLYAEDPANGFLPSTGTVLRYREPAGVRVDSGIAEGSEVGTAYDPMLAKVVAHGPDRAAALDRLDRALGELEVLGVATNAAFSRALLRRDDVRAGALDTGLLERVLDEPAPDPPEDLVPAAAIAGYRADTGAVSTTAGPWRRRLDGHGEVRVTASEVHVGERRWSWAARPADPGALRITLDGVSRRYAVAHAHGAIWVARDGYQLEARTDRPERVRAALVGSLEAPMPGTVLLVHVANGDEVAEGEVLLVLESMKMELSITAPSAGIVEGLEVRPGDRVTIKQPLVAVAT